MNRTWMPFQATSKTSVLPTLETSVSEGRPHGQKQRLTSAHREKDEGKDAGHIRSVTMSFRTIHEYGELFTKYLEARKHIFLDRLGWHVCEADGMEFDQYDTPQCRWVILHGFGEILGSVRMLPTTAQSGIYSYMLRDAQRGILKDLPSDVLFFEAPVEHSVWEATRFFITDAVPAKQRLKVQQLLFRRMIETAEDNGASYILGIVPSVWARWSRPLGVTATPIGAKFSIDGTSSQSVLFKSSSFSE